MYDCRHNNLLEQALKQYDALISKALFYTPQNLCLSSSSLPFASIQLLQVEVLPPTAQYSFFTFTLNAISQQCAAFAYFIECTHSQTFFYIGTKSPSESSPTFTILTNGLKSTFPTSIIRELSPNESRLKLKQWFNPAQVTSLSTGIVIPNSTVSQNMPFNQRLIDLMAKEDYVACFLATPFSFACISELIRDLSELSTTFSMFSQTNRNCSHSSSKGAVTHVARSCTESNGSSSTCTDGDTHACNQSHYTLVTPSTSIPLKNPPALNISMSCNNTEGTAETCSHSLAEGQNMSCATSKTNINISNSNSSESKGLSFSTQNKLVSNIIVQLNQLITRFNQALSTGLFCFSSYFIAPKVSTSIRSAFTYTGLASNPTLDLGPPIVFTLEQYDPQFAPILATLEALEHPCFCLQAENTCVTPTYLITPAELVNTFYFPFPLAAQN